MEPNYQNAAMLDMIFEGRNKAYGAYVLRRDQNKAIQQAMFIIFSSVMLLVIGKFVSDKMARTSAPLFRPEVVLEAQDIPKPPISTAAPKPPAPPPSSHNSNAANASNTVANREQRVTADNRTPDSVPNAAALHDHDIGLHTNTAAPLTGLGAPDGTGSSPSLEQGHAAPTALQDEPTRLPDVMPVFPGGEKALLAYLGSHTRFPAYLNDMGISGKVISEFTVNEDGTVTDVKILRSPDRGFDNEVIRVVKTLPAFKPGLQGGHPVKVRYVVPLMFKLQ